MIIKDNQQFLNVFDQLMLEEYLAVDTETEEFSDVKTHAFHLGLDGVGFAGEKIGVYVPYKILNDRVNRVLFQEILDTKELIFHNAKFDLTIFQAHDWDISQVKFHDTMIMAWLLNENRTSFALKKLAESVLKIDKEKIVEFRDVKKRPVKEAYGLFTQDFEPELAAWEEELGTYCISDCKYTYKLFQKFKPKVIQEGFWKVYTELEIPIVRVIMDMENRGITLDLDYLDTLGVELENELIEIKAKIWASAGKEFDISSPQQLSEVLFSERKYDLPTDYLTPTGAKSTNEAALAFLKNKHPEDVLLDSLLKYRELFKLNSAYIIGLKKKSKDGVIYTTYRQTKVVTGRFSSQAPNLQQLPARGDKYDIRRAFIPRPGYRFVICDLSQIELRVAAYFAQDPIMIKAFKEKKDIHTETAEAMGVDRRIAKTINFGILFGTSGYGMSKNLGITVEEADAFIKNYFDKFKSIKILVEQAKNTMKNNYAVWTLLKRKRRFPNYAQAKKEKDWKSVSHMERQCLNSIVQGTAADIIKIQMRNLHRILPEYNSHLLLTIHDEVVIEAPKDIAEEVLRVVKETMETAIELKNVPIIAEGLIADFYKK